MATAAMGKVSKGARVRARMGHCGRGSGAKNEIFFKWP